MSNLLTRYASWPRRCIYRRFVNIHEAPKNHRHNGTAVRNNLMYQRRGYFSRKFLFSRVTTLVQAIDLVY